MSMIFKPPEASFRAFTWRDLFAIGPEADPFWARVRRRQFGYMVRYMPLLLMVMSVNTAIIISAFGDQLPTPIFLAWFSMQVGLTLLWSGRRLVDRVVGVSSKASPRAVRQLVFEQALAGLAWALLFATLFPIVSEQERGLILAVGLATIAAMATPTAVFPLGSAALMAPVTVGLSIGLLQAGQPDGWAHALLLAGFVILVGRGNMLSAFSLLVRLRIDGQLREQEEVVRLLLNEYDANGSEWLFEFDAEGRVTFVSSRFSEVTGTAPHEVIGRRWTETLTDLEAARPLMEIVARGQPYRDYLLPVDIGGETRWLSLSGTPKFGRNGELLGYRGVGSDVTERQRATQRIAELATFDALTGLVNRRIIHQALGEGLQADGVALLFVDLDRFKAVNDSLGHGAGDRLLVEVAIRLRETVAQAASPRALVGRLGGDEFAVVLPEFDREAACHVGEQIIQRLSAAYTLGDKHASIGASIGLAIGPEDGDTVEALMRAADLALYDVKGKGRGSVRAYDRALHAQSEDRLALEFDLKSALQQNQFRLVFQPIVSAMDERVVAFEALLRWRHPTKGDISPAVFIPLAEESGLIGRIGTWVLNEACRTAASWPRHIQVAVNISPLQFDDPKLVDTVRKALSRFNVAPERLELELTESVFLDERPQTAAMLKELQQIGVQFALDDFGTGYSSLGYLQKISFRRIKIDRSFVQACASDGGESTAIIQAIVALAERLGMETTAEGTETRAEFEAMRRLGCGHMQGWYFGKPMPADETLRLLDRSRPLIQVFDADPFSVPGLPRTQPKSRAASARSLAAAEHSNAPRRQAPPEPRRG